jgi:hypothetical protein
MKKHQSVPSDDPENGRRDLPEPSGDKAEEQLSLFECKPPVVHFFDSKGGLRSARLVRWIRRGKKKGRAVVQDGEGKRTVTRRIRNVDYRLP